MDTTEDGMCGDRMTGGRGASAPGLTAPFVMAACGLLLAASALMAQTGPSGPPGFRSGEKLDSLLADPVLAGAHIGVKVVRMETGETLYERNPGKLFHPASNMKLLTTAAAIAFLPGEYCFRTAVYCDGSIEDSVLRGNLYVRGSGDPLLEVQDLDSIAGMVLAAGIRRIEGTIVGDAGQFDSVHWGKGWMWDDEPDPAEAFLSPLTLHANSLTLSISPGMRPGDTLVYEMGPPTAVIGVENRATTLTPGERDTLVLTRTAGGNRVILSGGLPAGSSAKELSVSLHDPSRVFLDILRERLALRGISTRRETALDSTRGRVLLGTIGRPVDSVITLVNTESHNLAAENLLRNISVHRWGTPGSAAGGLKVVREYLAGAGADPDMAILADGSGVSWYNAVSPDMLVLVLRDQYARRNTFQRFFKSLPVLGYNGTLRGRSAGSDAWGRVSAKTGTLTGVSTLTGYLTTKGHELLGFSIMINHFHGRVRVLREIQDALLEELIRLPAAD